jgi:circadian clock protein KaiB
MNEPLDSSLEFERAFEASSHNQPYLLRLYVTGMTPRSTEAFATIKAICDEYLPGRYELEVIDIYQQPLLAASEQIIAVPTLVKERPEPRRRFVGNLNDKQRLLFGLNIHSSVERDTKTPNSKS